MLTPRPFALGLALLLAWSRTAHADATPTADVPGSVDHPVISRFAGSLLVGYSQQDWAAATLPSADGLDPKNKRKLRNPLELEGTRTRLLYLGPRGKSPLEVFRNHQQALQAAGITPALECLNDCSDLYFALDKHDRQRGMGYAKGSVQGVTAGKEKSTWGLSGAMSYSEARMLSGSLQRGGQPLHVLLHVSVAENEHTDRAAVYLEVLEPKAMQTGQVSVNAAALQAGLAGEGKVTLGGLFFDTGKAELKSESKLQLDEMGQWLKVQAAAKVFIVGHTDNVGTFEANQALSLARAQAVVAALSQPPYKIDAKRLSAKGAANLAPVASNAAEAGRAKNRRVELVLQ